MIHLNQEMVILVFLLVVADGGVSVGDDDGNSDVNGDEDGDGDGDGNCFKENCKDLVLLNKKQRHCVFRNSN